MLNFILKVVISYLQICAVLHCRSYLSVYHFINLCICTVFLSILLSILLFVNYFAPMESLTCFLEILPSRNDISVYMWIFLVNDVFLLLICLVCIKSIGNLLLVFFTRFYVTTHVQWMHYLTLLAFFSLQKQCNLS